MSWKRQGYNQQPRKSYNRPVSSPELSRHSQSSASYQPSRQSYNRQRSSSTNYQQPRQSYNRHMSSSESSRRSQSSASYQPSRESYNRQQSSSTNYQSRPTSDWQTTGRVTRTKLLSGPVTSEAVHGLLSELPWLTSYDRSIINQARCEVSKEWNVFLKNATILIKLEDQDIQLISGSGTNKLVVQRNSCGEMDCDWQEKGIGMKLRNGARSVGRFFTSIFSSAKKALGSIAKKAIGWW